MVKHTVPPDPLPPPIRRNIIAIVEALARAAARADHKRTESSEA